MVRRLTRGNFVARNRKASMAVWAVLASPMLLGPLATHVFATPAPTPTPQQVDVCYYIYNNQDLLRLTTNQDGCKKPEKGPIPLNVTGPMGLPGSANAWSLTGNSGTTPGSNPGNNFLGTTDDQPLEIHVNGVRVMRYEPAATSGGDESPNLIGGDFRNSATGFRGATIAGGGGVSSIESPQNPESVPNSVQADFGTVGGGDHNTVSGVEAAVAGGYNNTASGGRATVAGGGNNMASGTDATVAGGDTNKAIGGFATVAGGSDNTANGNYSFAAGTGAYAVDQGAFVWSDYNVVPHSSMVLPFSSVAEDEFAVRATGGVRFVTGISTSGATTNYCSIDGGGDLSCSGNISGNFTFNSDRALKAAFEPVAARDVLKRVADLPLTSWSFKGQTVRHIGPMAQDFHAAFKVGEDDKHIATTDAEGVALAAIQGLYQMLEAKDAQLARQKKEMEQQRRQMESLNARLEKLERETQASRNAVAMHPAGALQPPRPSPVSRF